jgi:hypothetical protein
VWARDREPAAPLRVGTGARSHTGFMLRLTLGPWYAIMRGEAALSRSAASLYGAGITFSFDIGGAVAENLILHARAASFAIPSANASFDDSEELSFTGVMLGPGLTYYFMPVNIYVTLGLGISRINADGGQLQSLDIGFGTTADVGKEWWVSDGWGLGIAARFWLTHVEQSSGTIDAVGFGAVFSATMN